MNHISTQPISATTQLVRSLANVVGILVLLLSPALVSAASFPALARQLPASTDTLVAINVDKVLDSPYGKQQQWRETMAENWAKRPQIIAPGVRKLLMGAEFVPSKAETRWEVTLMDMESMPTLEDLCKAEGGNVDRVWDKDAVASPINAYFVPLSSEVLAVCTPAERSVIARWIRQPVKDDPSVTSEYIKALLATLSEETQVVMALDLQGAFGIPNIRRFLGDSELEELKGKNLDTVAQRISTLNGLKLQITVDKDIDALLSLSFDKDVTELDSAAKPLLIAVLDAAGMHLDDVATWKFTASGKEVRGTGKLSEESFRQLVGVVQSPVPAVVTAAASSKAATPADPVTASQRYYKSVSLIIDNLKTGSSAKETSTWWFQASKRIDNLPILNVDPVLVEWGTFVSMKLKQLAGVGAVGQTQMQARAAGVENPTFGYGQYDGNGDYYSNSRDAALAENYRRQRRQASLEQKSQMQQQASQILSEANGARQKVRAEMSAKYKVEF